MQIYLISCCTFRNILLSKQSVWLMHLIIYTQCHQFAVDNIRVRSFGRQFETHPSSDRLWAKNCRARSPSDWTKFTFEVTFGWSLSFFVKEIAYAPSSPPGIQRALWPSGWLQTIRNLKILQLTRRGSMRLAYNVAQRFTQFPENLNKCHNFYSFKTMFEGV